MNIENVKGTNYWGRYFRFKSSHSCQIRVGTLLSNLAYVFLEGVIKIKKIKN